MIMFVNLLQLCAVVDLNCGNITWYSCLYFSFNRAMQMNTNTMMWIVHVQLVHSVQHWRSRVICMVGGNYIPVMCALNHSLSRLISRYINAHIVENIYLPAVCVINHSLGSLIWRYINARIVESIHLPAVCVINHSLSRFIWRYINVHTVESIHLPAVCVINHSHWSKIWRYICAHILESTKIIYPICNKSFMNWRQIWKMSFLM